MHKYIVLRLLYAVPTLLGISLIIFFVLRVLPGDPLVALYGDGSANISEADRQAIEAKLGIDRPLLEQYGGWMGDLLTGDFGKTFVRGESVGELIRQRGVLTAEIAVLAVVVSWLVGLPVGILGAIRQNSIGDYVARFITILFLAIPAFWMAMLVVVGSLVFFSYRSPLGLIFPWDDFVGNMRIVGPPGIVLGLATASYIARLARSSLLEVIRDDYIRTARAKGLSERIVIIRHALRTALLPVITLSGVLFGVLLSGSVVVEQAFDVPGLGTALIRGFRQRDFVVVQNLVLLYGVLYLMINLLIDLAYGWLDPRIRHT